MRLESLADGVVIGETPANRPRPDLKAAGLGGGACAFQFEVPPLVANGRTMTVRRASDCAVIGRVFVPAPAREIAA